MQPLRFLHRPVSTWRLRAVSVGAAVIFLSALGIAAQTPAVGRRAPDFTLKSPIGHSIRLSSQLHKGPLILIMLRGYPGYQCPYCQRQVHDFIAHANEFAKKNAKVLLIYPGPSSNLTEHANEFLESESQLPANVTLVIDPDYTVTNLLGLRWNAPHETAYPSTFILDSKGKVLFEKISRGHGDRLSAEDALAQLSSHK